MASISVIVDGNAANAGTFQNRVPTPLFTLYKWLSLVVEPVQKPVPRQFM